MEHRSRAVQALSAEASARPVGARGVTCPERRFPASAHVETRPTRTRKAGLWLVAGLLALTMTPARAATILDWAPLFTRINHPVSIPVDFADGAMLVDVKINGAGPFHLVVDTGCSCTVISPEVAMAIDAHVLDPGTLIGTVNGLGDAGAVQQVLLDSLELGGVRFEGVTAGISSLALQSKVTGRRIDGLLGFSLFSELFLTLDFPNHRLGLSAEWPQNLPPVRAELDVTEYNAVPFVEVGAQGKLHEMMVDTGANSSLQFDPESAAAFSWKVAPRVAGLVAVLGGTGTNQLGRLSGTVTLGGIQQVEPVVDVGEGTPRIGTAFYRSYCVVFSRTQGKLWLCSASDQPIPSPAKRSVGLSLLADSYGWRVAGTIPGSPAEKAHLTAGDLITSIEHSPAHGWTRDGFQAWIDRHKTVTLAVTNATGTHDLTLPIWVIVP